MKRNKKAIKKVLKYLYANDAKISQNILQKFRTIYVLFMYKINNEKFFVLNEDLKRLIYIQLMRYKKINISSTSNSEASNQSMTNQSDHILNPQQNNTENITIDLQELKNFLTSIGSPLNAIETNMLISITSNSLKVNYLTCKDLYKAWAIMIKLQKIKPEDLIVSVLEFHFNEYFDFEKSINDFKNVQIKLSQLEETIKKYDLFDIAELNYIINESKSLGKTFTIREFALFMTSKRRHHSY
jgi:hypothetical protein